MEKRSNAVIGPTSYNPLQSVLRISQQPCLVAYVLIFCSVRIAKRALQPAHAPKMLETDYPHPDTFRSLYNDWRSDYV